MSVEIPDWLLSRFQALYDNPAHYEASYYGPINMFLATYFSAAAGFLVKPQSRLRQPPEAGARLSLDSNNQIVGTDAHNGNPDFLVSLGNAVIGKDVPLLIYEVKRHDVGPTEAAVQLDKYIRWCQHYLDQNDSGRTRMHVVLVACSTSTVFKVERDCVVQSEYTYSTSGDIIQALLQAIHSQSSAVANVV